MQERLRVLTGDRPTGKLHLGHWVGSIKSRLALQDDDRYDCFFLLADLHTLTTKPKKQDIAAVDTHVYDVLLDWLSVGIHPDKSTIYLQSAIPETYELHLILSMLTSINRVSNIPSIKEMAKHAAIDDASLSYGLIGYPILQTADILLARAHVVPVGKDNESHVELARYLARSFNRAYANVFHEPRMLSGEVTSLIGIDGCNKMSKSANNAIFLSDTPDVIRNKIRKLYTDPNRIHATTPGRVEGNPLFIYHDLFNPHKDEVEEFKILYRQGKVKDADVKARLAEEIILFLQPFQQRRQELLETPDILTHALVQGTERMRSVARTTLEQVRDAVGLSRKWHALLNLT